VADGSYLDMWTRIRKRLEQIGGIEQADKDELDQISKLLERVQKSELSLRDEPDGKLIVVNIHIPGICGDQTALKTSPETPPKNPAA
jgi:hypothetical protein